MHAPSFDKHSLFMSGLTCYRSAESQKTEKCSGKCSQSQPEAGCSAKCSEECLVLCMSSKNIGDKHSSKHFPERPVPAVTSPSSLGGFGKLVLVLSL